MASQPDAGGSLVACCTLPVRFSLGHGILPVTPVETLARLVAFVRVHARGNAAVT